MKTKIITAVVILASVLVATQIKAQFQITPSGNIGIGTTGPIYKLQVLGDRALFSSSQTPTSAAMIRCNGALSTQTTPDYTWYNEDQTGLFHPASFNMGFTVGGVERMRLQGGNLGIGTPSPTALLSVNGAANKVGGGSWTVFSDSRLKQDVQPFNDGLDKLLQINPVMFRYNGKAGITSQESYVGVVAQQIQKVLPYTVSEVQMNMNPLDNSSSEKTLIFDPNAITYILINSIKEQNKKITDLETQLSYCCTNKQETNTTGVNPGNGTGQTNNVARLLQNNPNPFSQQTNIGYYLPTDTKSASLMIFDMQGKLVKTIAVTSFGNASLTINANELSAGMFMYSLIADGKEVDSKRMILTQ